MATLYLYYNCEIIPEKNFQVDSISDYLATLTKAVVSNFQYQKNQLTLTVKIDSSQTNLLVI